MNYQECSWAHIKPLNQGAPKSDPGSRSSASPILPQHKQTPAIAPRGLHGKPLLGSAVPTSRAPGVLHMGSWLWRLRGAIVGVFCRFPGGMQSTIHTGEDFPHRAALNNRSGLKLVNFVDKACVQFRSMFLPHFRICRCGCTKQLCCQVSDYSSWLVCCGRQAESQRPVSEYSIAVQWWLNVAKGCSSLIVRKRNNINWNPMNKLENSPTIDGEYPREHWKPHENAVIY